MAETILGRDALMTDEMTTLFLRRGDRLIARCEYDGREEPVDPSDAAAELDRRAAVSRDMAGRCRRQGLDPGDYPERARVAEGTAGAIRAAFPEAGRAPATYLSRGRRRRIEALSSLISTAVIEGLATEPEFDGEDVGRIAHEVSEAFRRLVSAHLATEPPATPDGDGRED
jgi:hypothetical protein